MGVFSVPIKVRNWQSQFLPPEKQGREIACEAIVDSGAIELALPVDLVEQLNLEEVEDVWADKETYRIGDQEMEVGSLEGLRKMKRVAGRPQDLADFHHLELDEQNEAPENG